MAQRRMYATVQDFVDFMGGDDAEEPIVEPTAATLRRASGEVDGHLRTSVYATDEDGYPIDTEVSDALRDATCAYIAYWQETGDITGADAIAGPVKILSVQLGGTATGGASSRTPADTRRADEAVTILRNAGLITSAVAHT